MHDERTSRDTRTPYRGTLSYAEENLPRWETVSGASKTSVAFSPHRLVYAWADVVKVSENKKGKRKVMQMPRGPLYLSSMDRVWGGGCVLYFLTFIHFAPYSWGSEVRVKVG